MNILQANLPRKSIKTGDLRQGKGGGGYPHQKLASTMPNEPQLESPPPPLRAGHPIRRAAEASGPPASDPTCAADTDTPEYRPSASDRRSSRPLRHSPAAQTESHPRP